jgi:phosphoribosylformylglycinamidine synthase
MAEMFAEELGAVLQVNRSDLDAVMAVLRANGLEDATLRIGSVSRAHHVRVTRDGKTVFEENLFALRAVWSDVTRRIAALRDNPACAESEFRLKLEPANPGIQPKLTFSLPTQPRKSTTTRPAPAVAILREQGVNGQIEMAAAFTRAGFRAVDVHMTDILAGRVSLRDFRGLAACGGFSYGDVLGAGEGWAKSVLFNDRARAEFTAFFAREDAFALGVCNGCQMMSNLRGIIPGAELWPRFVQNLSERYEARFVSIKLEKSPSVVFSGMEGSVIPIAVAHGEGFAEFRDAAAMKACSESGLVAGRFVNNHHEITEQYPLNPNGSPLGMTALTTTTGRVTIMMPHPERVFRTAAMSWAPSNWGEDSPWMKLFYNARDWVG